MPKQKLIKQFGVYAPIMGENIIQMSSMTFFRNAEYVINSHVLTLHNKMVWQKERIDTWPKYVEACSMQGTYQVVFGQKQ